ncbi:poly(U)-specific endoribonuclease [Marchantia polymorpha subsp. ruderalis]|uniref:EndoU domain-containing protein n=2 Tax=Marchantia polymorpha TaxID=3197 RepID=A0AAF6BET1_MARPO|nr:hypothetical protein MARPO_0141s0023 [Marchantia polymorpha]BBN10515.1 hypothetical protein Mp_5g04160 [Marchantia polymorpha subsp. ruderalis]|eukprot:PTQ29444.1 hypothetical protein MARPO_0141s0023 [Marchantia polymorpha]
MSYNEDDQGWQTVGGGDGDGGNRRNRRNDNDEEGGNENVWNNNRRRNDDDEGHYRPPRRDDNEGETGNAWSGGRTDNYEEPAGRRPQSGSYGRQDYQADEEAWPSLGDDERPPRRQGRADEASSWRPQEPVQQLHSHTQEHQLTEELRHNFKLPASEQQYAESVSSDVNTDPSNDELEDVAAACAKLWELDINRLTPGTDYEIDCGEGKKMYQREDMEENALFRHLDPSVFRRPTYARFVALLDNYNASMSVSERKSREEEQEEEAFVEEISRTAPIQYLKKYLSSKGIVRGGDEQFKNMLRNLWFKMFDRSGTDDSSSAFEHVFVGEIKRGRDNSDEVSGLHNWIQFYLEEAKGTLDYQGFILPRRRGDELPDSQSQLLTVQFKWNGFLKPLSSTLVGVSPEFEMALYTLCFYGGQEDNHVQLGPYSVNIKVYPLGRNGIGSAFPIAEE